ncbi:MAG: hypothetical protein QG668_438, partial [Patescibacteria group bacterium]|nr:hypothetical protein [Patescibacteria group bacterium]
SGNGYGVQFGADFFGGALGDQFYTAHGNVIRNSVFTANIQDDVLTDSSGQNILSNSSFDRTAVNVSQAGGSMLVKYDARVRTLKGSDGSTAVSSVVTSFTDGLGTETAGGSTSSGYTNYTSLPAHTITNASNALTTGGYNAYTVETEALSGYTASSTSAILSEPNQTVTIYLVSEEANAPGAPTITALSGTTASIGVDENSNGGTVEYTLYNSTSASYVAADGSASATAAWQTAANWEAATISGLTCNTAYSFVMNARNALGDVTATSSAGVVTTSACSSGGGGGGGGGDGSSGGGGGGSSGGGATSAGPGAFYVPLPIGSTPPVSTEPVLPPVVAPAPETPSTPAPITEVPTAPTAPASNQARTQVSSDATSFRVMLAPQDQERLASFIDAGTTPATQALGSGERRALVRDALDTMGRAPTQTDLERLAQGQIPQTRNLTREREQLPRARSTFRTIYGRDPNFQNPEENLAWNTLMYRIRFTRDLAEERQGITTFRQTFRRAPSDPFQWAVVRVLGYVR